MKKLLALVLVLAVCGLANATVMFELDGPISALPGETVRLNIVSDAGLFALDVIATLNLADGAGSIAGAMAADAGIYGWDYTNYPDTPVLTATTAELGGTQFNVNTHTIVGYVDVLAMSGKIVVDLAGGYGLNAAMTMDGDTNEVTVQDSVTIIVPEPATIAVLSLGGLLLRRKK